jgi:DNA adenine methylase
MITEFAKALRLNDADLLDKRSRMRRITDARHIYWAPSEKGRVAGVFGSIWSYAAISSEIKRAWAIYVLSHQSFYAILDSTWKCSRDRPMTRQLQVRKESFTEEYSGRLEHTSIFCRDALDVIKKTDSRDTFHYIDPPYFNADMGHYAGYTANDSEKLLILLTSLGSRFMLSSYPSDILQEYTTMTGWEHIGIRTAPSGRRRQEDGSFNHKLR